MRSAPFPLAALAVLLIAASAWADAPALDPALPSQARKSDPVTYDVEFVATVTAPYGTRVLRVWLALPSSDGGQEVTPGEITTFPADVKPAVGREKFHGNAFAYFEFVKPEGAQLIRHRFRIKVWELRWDVDPDRVARVTRWPDTFAPYLQGDASVAVDDRLRTAARTAVPTPRGAGRDLADIMDWVSGRMRYDHGAASLRASSAHALETAAGHCSDYHGLCAACGRALGYPTRVAYGINAFPKQSPSHCKLEAYLPPYGWVSFDVSETQRLMAAIRRDEALSEARKTELVAAAQARLRSGFRDNTWFAQTRGTDYELEPRAARRVAVVRTLYAEADGVALPEPDPADKAKREFAWMTAHKYTPDRRVDYPFASWRSLVPRD